VEAQRERIYLPYLLTYIYPQTADTRAGRSRRKVHACMRAWSMDVKIHTYLHRRAKKKKDSKSIPSPNISPFSILSHMHPFDGTKSNKNSTQVSYLVHDPLGARKDGSQLLPNCSENSSLHSTSYDNPLTLLNPSRPQYVSVPMSIANKCNPHPPIL
jgi:hypothetical protein